MLTFRDVIFKLELEKLWVTTVTNCYLFPAGWCFDLLFGFITESWAAAWHQHVAVPAMCTALPPAPGWGSGANLPAGNISPKWFLFLTPRSHQRNRCICIRKRVHFYRKVKQTEQCQDYTVHFPAYQWGPNLLWAVHAFCF